MTIKENIEEVESLQSKLQKAIYNCKERLEIEKIFDATTDRVLYYALSEENQDENNIDYYIDVYDKHGALEEGSVYTLNSHGEMLLYINNTGEKKTINVSSLSSSEYFTILQIMKNSWKLAN